MKNKQEVELEYNCKLQSLAHNSVLSAIPMAWKTKIKGDVAFNFALTEWDITHHLWTGLIGPKFTCLHQRQQKILKLQSLQFSILHRFTTYNYILKLWNKIDSPMCQSCNVIDSIEHIFFHCDCIHRLWDIVKIMSKDVLNLIFNGTVLEILLGIPCQKSSFLQVLNLIISLMKQFIYISKNNYLLISENAFHKTLRSKQETHLYLLRLKGSHVDKGIILIKIS